MNPKITVFIPYYNDEAFLFKSIESVMRQTFVDFELVLLNHASKDSSRNIAHSFTDKRIKHIDLPINIGGGGGILLKSLLNVAMGEYFKPFCADDVMLPDCLEKLSNVLDNHQEVNVVFADKLYIDDFDKPIAEIELFDGKLIKDRITWVNSRDSLKNLVVDRVNYIKSRFFLKKYLLGISLLPWVSSMVRLKDLRSANIDNNFILMVDMALWIEIIAKTEYVIFIKDLVCNYRIHDNQISGGDKLGKVNWKRVRFESIYYPHYFFFIKDPNLVSGILDSEFSQKLTNNDQDLIPFVFAHYFIKCGHKGYRVYGIMKMHDILNNDCLRLKIERKFGYGVKEFRDEAMEMIVYNNDEVASYGKFIDDNRVREFNYMLKNIRSKTLFKLLVFKIKKNISKILNYKKLV